MSKRRSWAIPGTEPKGANSNGAIPRRGGSSQEMGVQFRVEWQGIRTAGEKSVVETPCRGGSKGVKRGCPEQKSPGNAPIAQLDRASVYGTEGLRFEPSWVYYTYDDRRIPGTEFGYRIPVVQHRFTLGTQPRIVAPSVPSACMVCIHAEGDHLMAREPKPWYRQDRQAWFVTIAGVRHNLGPEKKPAYEQFHALMLAPAPKPVVEQALPPPSSMAFAVLADRFLDWVKTNRAPDTYEWYRYRLERFCQFKPELTVNDLKPYHVQEWVDSYPDLSQTSRRNYIRSVKRCVKWAKRQGRIDANPIDDMEVPGAEARELYLTKEEFRTLLTHIPDAAMRTLCTVAFETGCRPQEILRVEARYFEAANERWVFPVKQSKGKKAPRIVYLSGESLNICNELSSKYPLGKLFRNSEGKPWTTAAVNCAFCRLQYRTGKLAMQQSGISLDSALLTEKSLDEETRKLRLNQLTFGQRRRLANRAYAKHVPKYSLYTLRHSWATNALQSGMDALTVAILMGHRDPATLAKVYQHLAHNPEFMRKQARRVSGH